MTDERIVAVTMPKWGLSMRLGKITGWIVAEGNDVSVGDELADIETEKIAGTTTFRPGICVNSGYRHCECCAAARSPAPYMVRITTGVTALPPNMYRNFAAWL